MKVSLRLPLSRFASRRLPFFISLFIMAAAQSQTPFLTINKALPRDTTQRIVYGNNVFLACMVSPVRLFTSTDGITWAATSSPDFGHSAYLRPAFAYGTGLFVCVADSGKIYTSPDAATWTRRNSGKTISLHDVQFLQNTFYAVGDSATLLYSANGIDWVSSATGIGATTDAYDEVAYGNGSIVITATTAGAGTVVYRGDANTLGSWTSNTIPYIQNLQFLNDRFYLFTENGAFTSADGVSWTALTLPPFTYAASNGFYDGSQYYLIADEGVNGIILGRIYTSTDGINFTDNGLLWSNELNAGLYVNQRYFIYGDNGILSSTDGSNYTALGAEFNALASNGHGYVGVGSSDGAGLFFESPDFVHWTSLAPGNEGGNYSALYDGSRYLVCSNDGGATIWASTDGLTWTIIGPVVFRGNGVNDIVTIAYGTGQYLGLGTQGLVESPDGSNWDYVPGMAGFPVTFTKIKYVSGYFFAIGDSATHPGTKPALFAAQNVSGPWQSVTPSLPFAVESFDDIVYDSITRQYTVVGVEAGGNSGNTPIVLANTSNPAGFFSVSTSNIADPSSYGAEGTVTSTPAGAVLRGSSFAYSHGYFVGGALDTTTLGSGYLLYSTDALHWSTLPLGTIGSNFIGNASSADTFRLLTQSNVQVTANFSGVALPITLLNLNAAVVAATTLLTWQTASEQNSLQFVVQRSLDDVQWDSIGSVTAAGQSDITRDYSFTDLHPGNGYNYYRLALVDINGSRQYSPEKRVWIGPGAAFSIYPNPAGSRVTLQLPETGSGTAILYDASGGLVSRQEFSGNTVNFSLQGLPAGVYHLWAQQNGKQYIGEVLH